MLMKLTRFVDVFLDRMSVLHVFTPRFFCLIVKYVKDFSFGIGHILFACCSALKYLKPTKSLLFSAVAVVTIFGSADFMPGKALQPASRSLLPLMFGAFVSTAAWALAAFPHPTPNATCGERLGYTTARAVGVHFAPRRGAAPEPITSVAAEPTRADVFGVFFYSLMCLVLNYLLYVVGSLDTLGTAHAIYLILSYIEEVKPQRHILVTTILLVSIVLTSGDHASETVNKFACLVTVWYIMVLTALVGVVSVLFTTSQQLTTAVLGWLSSFTLLFFHCF